MKGLRQLLPDRSGAAALEFALIGLPLILLLLGVIEFGRGLHIRNALDAAGDRAQRVIIINPLASDTTLNAAIKGRFQAGPPALLAITYGTETVSGIKYRLISLDYTMQLLLPAPLGRTLHIASTRRVALPN